MLNELKLLRKSANSGDIAALDEFLFARKRTQNRSQDYMSPLMISANNIDHLLKIEQLSCDAIVLNLEDGVDRDQKAVALRLCAFALSRLPECSKKLIVRVNALDDGGIDEIEILNNFAPDAIRVPKISNRSDVELALKHIADPIEVHLSIESSDAWLNLKELRVDSRVKAFYLGLLDLFVDLDLPQSLISVENPTIHHILARFLITSKALGVKPIGSIYQEHNNMSGFEKWLELEKRIGFEAKGALSPTQASVIQLHFQKDLLDLQKAKEIVEIFTKHGSTAHSRYGFIDEPIYKDALNRLKRIQIE